MKLTRASSVNKKYDEALAQVPAKLCAEEACLLCHDEEISCK